MTNSFVVYDSFIDSLKFMDDATFGICMRALSNYALNGIEPNEDQFKAVPILWTFFSMAKPQIDANKALKEAH